MIFSFYNTPEREKSWAELCRGAITDVTSWEYEKLFCGIGTFELVVPANADGIKALGLDKFMFSADGGFIIKKLEYTAESVRVSGYDLNGLLLDRLTVAKQDATTQAVNKAQKFSAPTETIVKRLVFDNCVNPPDKYRSYINFSVAEDQKRGYSSDKALVYLQCLADVVSELLEAQCLGWRISAKNLGTDQPAELCFDVCSGINRIFHATKRNGEKSMTFAYGLGSADSIRTEISSANNKTKLYCRLANNAIQVEGSGSYYSRKEDYVDLNCELADKVPYVNREKAARGTTQTITVEHIDPTKFGKDFDLGDFVSVYDKFADRGVNYSSVSASADKSSQITAVKIRRSGDEYDVTVTVGDQKPKLIDRVTDEIDAVAQETRSPRGVSWSIEFNGY